MSWVPQKSPNDYYNDGSNWWEDQGHSGNNLWDQSSVGGATEWGTQATGTGGYEPQSSSAGGYGLQNSGGYNSTASYDHNFSGGHDAGVYAADDSTSFGHQDTDSSAFDEWMPQSASHRGDMDWGTPVQPEAELQNISVVGCQHPTIGPIVCGNFSIHQTRNHGKPVYKRTSQANGLDVMLYYWDDRDGPPWCGWWFGPKVGGDHIWAYHPKAVGNIPPSSGWKVPYDGPVDSTFRVSPATAAGKGAKRPATSNYAAVAELPSKVRKNAWGETSSWDNSQSQFPQLSQRAPSTVPRQDLLREKQAEEARKRLEEQRLKLEADKRAAEARKKMEEESRKKMQIEAQKKAMEEQRRKREEELKRQQELKLKRDKEQRAASAIRAAIQKLKPATSLTFPDVRQEVETALNTHISSAGSMMATLSNECEVAVRTKEQQLEELRKRQEEIQRKKELAEQKVAEQRAAAAIRRTMQKIRVATPETIDVLEEELRETLQRDLANAGSMAATVEDECNKAIALAKKRVEQIAEQRRKAEEKRIEVEKAEKEHQERIKQILQELEEYVVAAEADDVRLKQALEPLTGKEVLSTEEVLEATAVLEAVHEEAKATHKACTDYISAHKEDLKTPQTLQVSMKLKGVAPDTETLKKMPKLMQRIDDCKKAAENSMAEAEKAKTSATRRAAALDKTNKLKTLFDKYDSDKDGVLSEVEVCQYALSEFDFKVPEATLNVIQRNIWENGDSGVKFENFILAKMAIGTVREQQRDAKRRAARAEKDSQVAMLKAALLDKAKSAGAAVNDAEKEITKCEKNVQEMKAKAKKLATRDIIPLVREADSLTEAARVTVAAVRKEIASVFDDVDDRYKEELKSVLTSETKKHEIKLGRLETRITRAENLCKQVRDDAAKKKHAELGKLKRSILKVVRYNQIAEDLTAEELFKRIDSNGDGAIDEREFSAFLEKADKEIKTVSMQASSPENAQGEVLQDPTDENVEKQDEVEESAGAQDEQQAAIDEKKASMAIRRVLQKLRVAKPDTFDAIKSELEEVMLLELESTGSQKDAIKEESAKAIELAKKRIERLREEADKKDGSSTEVTKTDEKEVAGKSAEGKTETIALAAEDVSKLFAALCDEEEGDTVSRETFERFVRAHVQVVKDAVMTNHMSISKGRTVRRLVVDDLLEVLKGPFKDESASLMRVQARAYSDNSEGWVTIAGNQGTAYLKEGGNTFKVIKETILTEDFGLDGGKDENRKLKTSTRKLKTGEFLELYERPMKEEKSGLTRMKVRAMSDGHIGWVTTRGNTGSVFVELA